MCTLNAAYLIIHIKANEAASIDNGHNSGTAAMPRDPVQSPSSVLSASLANTPDNSASDSPQVLVSIVTCLQACIIVLLV